MNVWLDLGIAALIILFGYSGYKRGLVYMAINAAGTIVSVILAALLSSMFSTLIYHSFFKDNIVNNIAQQTAGIETSDPVLAAESVMGAVSNFTANVFSFSGIDNASLANTLKQSAIGIPGTVEELIRPFAIKMISSVLTIIIFLILMIVVGFLARKFTKAIDRMALGMPNRILGALVGIVQAVFIAMLLSLIVYFIMMFISPEACASLNDSMEHTVFYQLITKISLPNLIVTSLSSL